MFFDANCAVVADGNSLAPISNCIATNLFGGDMLFAGIFIILIFAFMIWKGRFPLSVALPVGTLLSFSLSTINQVFMYLFLLSIVANGVMLVMGLIAYAKK